MEVTIKGKTYHFKVTSWWGPLYLFEDIMDVAHHPENKFNMSLSFHLHVMFYAVLMNDNESLDITLEEFLQELNDLELHTQLRDYYIKRTEILTRHSGGTEESAEDTKKKD